ncbi:MAG: flagellar basal body P-ring formation chaperone FlgA [Planctomycetota bacterium]
MNKRIAILLAGVCIGANVHSATIELRSMARLDQGEVTLGEVAHIAGDESEDLANTVIADSPADLIGSVRVGELAQATFRLQLESAGINLSRHAVSGGVCVIRVLGESGSSDSEKVETEADKPTESHVEAEDVAASSVREHIVGALVRKLDIDTQSIRVRFDERDAAVLNQSTWGLRVVCLVESSAGSGIRGSRMMVRTRVYAGDRLAVEERIAVHVEVHREVLRLTRSVRRGEAFASGSPELVRLWESAGAPGALRTLKSDSGVLIARRSLEAGEVIRERDIEIPIAVKRNGLITVVVMRGGIELQTQARALEEGKIGDVIECQLSRDRQPFLAEVVGIGRVAIIQEEQNELASAAGTEGGAE